MDRELGETGEHVIGAGIAAAPPLGGLDHRAQLGEDRGHHRVQQLFAGPEVVVDGGFGEPELVGDHLQRRAGEAVPGEQVDGDVDQPGPGVDGAVGGVRGVVRGVAGHRTRSIAVMTPLTRSYRSGLGGWLRYV